MNKLILLTLLGAMAYACSGPSYEEKDIVGGWKYDTTAILASVNPQQLEAEKLSLLRQTMALYKDAVIRFNEDGSMVIETNGIRQMGHWQLSLDGSKLIFNLSGKDQANEISELSSKRMTLAPLPEKGLFYPRIFVPVPATEKEAAARE